MDSPGLSAAGLRFLAVLCPLGNWPALTIGLLEGSRPQRGCHVPHPALQGAPAQELVGVCVGQRLRHFAGHVAQKAGVANGERVRRWCQDKKAGWYAVLANPQMPVTSTLLDQAHNTIERKLFATKGFHHPGGSQQAFLTGLAHLITWSRISGAPSIRGSAG